MGVLTYADSGVNREAADRLVEKIAILSKGTLNKKVKGAVGGYASLFELDQKNWIAASTDGVGTKLKLAFRLNHHRTVGIDLVAMSVNDLLCVGSIPLFFLDYFATGRLNPGVSEEVLQGIADGCRQAGCALVGGETAEMPDFYSEGEYDLAGFAVGVVNPKHVLPRKEIRAGDRVIGVASSGVHSNGFSLLRRLLPSGQEGDALASELLTPTRIYVRACRSLLEDGAVKGLAHITGSGFLNVPRISEKFSYDLKLPSRAQRPRIYDWIRARSGLSLRELSQTFNLGIGMVIVVSPRKADQVLKALKKSGEKAWELGHVIPRRRGHPSQVILHDEEESTILDY